MHSFCLCCLRLFFFYCHRGRAKARPYRMMCRIYGLAAPPCFQFAMQRREAIIHYSFLTVHCRHWLVSLTEQVVDGLHRVEGLSRDLDKD